MTARQRSPSVYSLHGLCGVDRKSTVNWALESLVAVLLENGLADDEPLPRAEAAVVARDIATELERLAPRLRSAAALLEGNHDLGLSGTKIRALIHVSWLRPRACAAFDAHDQDEQESA